MRLPRGHGMRKPTSDQTTPANSRSVLTLRSITALIYKEITVSEEGKLFAITGFGGGISVGIKADNYDEFVALARQVFGSPAGDVFAQEVFGQLKAYTPGAGAVQLVHETPGVGPVTMAQAQPQSTIGVLPQPGVVAQPVAAAPPNLQSPGNCAHGPRQYKSTRTKSGQWDRWECAIPWSRGAQGRCEAINVGS